MPEAAAEARGIEIDWQAVFIWGWVGVSALMGVRLVWMFFCGSYRLGRAKLLGCEEIEAAAEAARRKVGIEREVGVYSIDLVCSPVIWCWGRRPMLLLPAGVEGNGQGVDWVSVFCHELAHWKRRDHVVGLMAELIVCVLPWHVGLWWAKRRLTGLSEQACDDWVVDSGGAGEDYAESLLDLLPGRQLGFTPAVVSSEKGLAGRVRRILRGECGNPRTGFLWGLATVLLVTVLVTAIAFAQTRQVEVEEESEFEVTLANGMSAKREGKPAPVPKGGVYENAKGSKNHKIKVGPTKFQIHTVVRYDKSGQPMIKNPDGSQKRVIDMETPDFSSQSQWMDIAQIYLSPEQTMYDVLELRVFDHHTRKLVSTGDYPGIGFRIDDSVVTVYSTGKMLPESLDIWMRVLHRKAKHIYILIADEQAAVDIDGNILRVLDIAKGQYSWANDKRGKHHDQWDEYVTSVAMKFDKLGNKRYQICAVGKDGRRAVPDYPHFLHPSAGWQLVEFGISMDQIKYFEIIPFNGRDRFFFDDVKLPRRSGSLDSIPFMRFEINGRGGKHQRQVDSFFDVELNIMPNTETTGIQSSYIGLGQAFKTKKSTESLTAIVCKVNGFGTKNITFSGYDKDGNMLDLSKRRRSRWSGSVNGFVKHIDTKIPVENIYTIDVYFEKNIENIPSMIKTDVQIEAEKGTVDVELEYLSWQEAGENIAPVKQRVYWKPSGEVVDNDSLPEMVRMPAVNASIAWPSEHYGRPVRLWFSNNFQEKDSLGLSVNPADLASHISFAEIRNPNEETRYSIVALALNAGQEIPEQVDIEASYAAGAWETVLELDTKKGKVREYSITAGIGWSCYMSEKGLESELAFDLEPDRNAVEYKHELVGHKDKVQSFVTSRRGREGLSNAIVYKELEFRDLRKVKIQKRQRSSKIFKDVSLKPNLNAAVAVEEGEVRDSTHQGVGKGPGREMTLVLGWSGEENSRTGSFP